jgi:hypothetical protein
MGDAVGLSRPRIEEPEIPLVRWPRHSSIEVFEDI